VKNSQPYFDKTVEGFGGLFRHLSYEEIGQEVFFPVLLPEQSATV